MRSEIRASGATLPELFARAALAALAGPLDSGALEEREVREVRAHGDTAEALFAHFLTECLYVLEVEGFAWRRIDFAVFVAEPRAGAEPMRLHAFLHGQAIEPGAQRELEAIAPLTARSVTLRTTGDGYEMDVMI